MSKSKRVNYARDAVPAPLLAQLLFPLRILSALPLPASSSSLNISHVMVLDDTESPDQFRRRAASVLVQKLISSILLLFAHSSALS